MVCTDQPILALGLESLLKGKAVDGLIRVASIDELIARSKSDNPDVLMIDLDSDCGISYGDLNAVMRQLPKANVVLWYTSISGEFAFSAVNLGVKALLMKSQPLAQVWQCLDRVQSGHTYIGAELSHELLTMKRVVLTPRESELVVLLARGLSNKDIATELCISEGTVKVYLSRLFDKTGAADRFELGILAAVVCGQSTNNNGGPPSKGPLVLPVPSHFQPAGQKKSLLTGMLNPGHRPSAEPDNTALEAKVQTLIRENSDLQRHITTLTGEIQGLRELLDEKEPH